MIPEAIYKYNVYDDKSKQMIGIGEEMALPNLEPLTTTISGSGMLGEVESPLLGMFGSMEMEIPFRLLNQEAFSFMGQAKKVNLTIRGAQQVTNNLTHELDYESMRIVVRGRNKGMTGGKLKQGSAMESAVKVEITYILIEVLNKKMLELDKFNSIYIVDGIDQMTKVRAMC